jgi:hypothetical protein
MGPGHVTIIDVAVPVSYHRSQARLGVCSTCTGDSRAAEVRYSVSCTYADLWTYMVLADTEHPKDSSSNGAGDHGIPVTQSKPLPKTHASSTKYVAVMCRV